MPENEVIEAADEETSIDADFDAGFAGSNDPIVDTTPVEPPAAQGEQPATDEATTQDDKPEEKPAEPETAPEPEAQTVQLTKADFDRLMAKAAEIDQIKPALDKAFGKVGGLERTLSQLAQARGPVEITEADFADIAGDYPELAKANFAAMKRVLDRIGNAPAAAAVQPDVIEKLVSERVAPLQKQLAMTELTVMRPSWKSDISTPAFREWVDSLPPEEHRQTVMSEDPAFVAQQLKKFDAAQQAKAPQPKPKPADPRSAIRQKQMQAAVNPKSAGAAPSSSVDDDEAAFMSGFKSR